MERKNYYSWAFALLCTLSTNAVAQTVPRPALFGIDINAATQQRVPENKAKSSTAPFGTTTKSVAKAHVVPAPKSSEETINVLTGIKHYDGKDKCIGTSTFEYDKQGRILVEDNGYSRYDYTYTDNADGEWIEMLVVETNENGAKTKTLSKREFDSQGRIIAGYTYRSNSTDGQLELDFEANYAYTDSGECIQTKMLYSIGRTNDNDVVWNGFVLTWYEPIQDYIEDNYYWDKYSETSVEGDICTTNYYKLKSDSEGYSQGFYKYKTWSRSSTNKDFIMVEQDQWAGIYPYSLIYTYNIDGSLSNRDGCKYEIDAPAKGYTRKTEYHSFFWADELWTPSYRESYTNGFDEKKLNSEGYREKISEGYNTFTGWHVNMKERYEAVPFNIDGISIQKYIITNYDKEGNETSVRTRNTFYNTSDNSEVYNIYLYDNGNYVKGESESAECFVYVFYDSNGKELKRLRSILESSSNKYDHRYIHEELKDGVWTKITNQKIEIGENEKLILQLDENGYTKYDETYSNGKIYSRSEYTYTDDGYTMIGYLTTSNGELYKQHKYESYLSSDNVLTTISVGYVIDGKIMYGTKREQYPNGLVKNYRIQPDGTFKFSSKSISDYVSTDENGYVTTIKRTVDDQDNENVDEVSKTKDNSYIESYEKKDGKWVGVNKEENTRVVFPEFDLVPNNDSRVMVENWRIFFGCSDFDSKYYAWDTANDAWVLDRSNVSEFAVNGSMLEYKSKSHSQKYDVEVTGYVKRDDAHRMTEICRVDKTIYPNGNTEVNRTLLYKYTYNSDGKLAQQEIYQDDIYLGRTVYIYGDIVVTEVEQIIDGAAYKLRISGRDIVANSKSAIKLYDMSGRVVAQGSNGKVVAPANGMYVVSVDGKNIKISVNAK